MTKVLTLEPVFGASLRIAHALDQTASQPTQWRISKRTAFKAGELRQTATNNAKENAKLRKRKQQ